jgi:phospholipid/cholesterol/gamma-HCH transport system permease protein
MSDGLLTAPRLVSSEDRGGVRLFAEGHWSVDTVAALEPAVEEAAARRAPNIVVDLTGVTHLDTAGAWLFHRLGSKLAAGGSPVSFAGMSESARRLLTKVNQEASVVEAPPPPHPKPFFVIRFLSLVGATIYDVWRDFTIGMDLLGDVVRGVGISIAQPRRLRFTSIVAHLDRTGLQAVPIIFLISFVIGAIIAQQGAFLLRNFGADFLIVDLVGILVLREIGVLITAIMVAGRSGSAYTAELGSMKMREEVDALTVIGLDPAEVLVLPRLIALIIALPLLTFIADMSALAGGAIVSAVYVGMPIETFIQRLRDAVGLNTFYVGLIKAPFMALIIGLIAAAEGFKVSGSAESLGRQTTSSVVKAIFMVIVVDGLFAIFFSAINY